MSRNRRSAPSGDSRLNEPQIRKNPAFPLGYRGRGERIRTQNNSQPKPQISAGCAVLPSRCAGFVCRCPVRPSLVPDLGGIRIVKFVGRATERTLSHWEPSLRGGTAHPQAITRRCAALIRNRSTREIGIARDLRSKFVRHAAQKRLLNRPRAPTHKSLNKCEAPGGNTHGRLVLNP